MRNKVRPKIPISYGSGLEVIFLPFISESVKFFKHNPNRMISNPPKIPIPSSRNKKEYLYLLFNDIITHFKQLLFYFFHIVRFTLTNYNDIVLKFAK